MIRTSALLLCAALAFAPTFALAQTPQPQAPLTAAESAFYAAASSTLLKLYRRPAAAIKAGWYRYNNEDRTGAISYINPKYFETPDPQHPQQLWYDVHGRLLGGDFSQTYAAHPNGPTLFGISPERFGEVPLHIHYGIKHANGTIEYGVYVDAAEFAAAGLNPLKPTPADLVKLHKVTSVADVAFVFANLHNWDATMWLIPNPAGQFADANPNIHPSPDQGKAPSERKT